MPTFTFWKNPKLDEAKSPLLSNGVTAEVSEISAPSTKMLELDPGSQDSGVFYFEEADLPSSSPSTVALEQPGSGVEPESDAKRLSTPEIMEAVKEMGPDEKATVESPNLVAETVKSKSEQSASAAPGLADNVGDRDSGVYLSDDESLPSALQPTSSVANETLLRSQPPSFSLNRTPSAKSTTTVQRTDSTARRLRRPADLNLEASPNQVASKPRSELEMRFDSIRNSKTRSKTALRSPTELLRERLNLSPKKNKHEEKIRVFTPPKTVIDGCLLPGPGASMEAFISTSVRARTASGGRPAWWCKFDKLVVFDGIEVQEDGELQIHTRSSKGLSIARRRGDMETIVIPMDCTHCQKMLHRQEWKYDMRVCKRSVCWDCKERCKWEHEGDAEEQKGVENILPIRTEANRDRADSVLQDDNTGEEDLMRKIGIEQGRPKSPMEVLGGIEERLESVVDAVM